MVRTIVFLQQARNVLDLLRGSEGGHAEAGEQGGEGHDGLLDALLFGRGREARPGLGRRGDLGLSVALGVALRVGFLGDERGEHLECLREGVNTWLCT